MIVEKSEIAPKLSRLKSIVPSKIITEGNQSIQGILYKNNSLQATNLEISIKTEFEKGEDETFIIPARAIDLIENLPEGKIEIIPEENSIRIKAKGINNTIQTFNPREFPTLSTETETPCGTISSAEFAKAVNSVIYAADEKAIKPVLSGINFDSKDGKLNIVGCDGYRIACIKIDYDNEFNFIIPKMHLKNVLSLCKGGDIEIYSNKINAVFKNGEFTIYTRLLEGLYINYTSTFKKGGNIVVINRHILLESLKRALINTNEKSESLTKLTIKDNKMTINTESSVSQYTEEIELEKEIDEPLTIAFNGIYLMDCIKALDEELLKLNFGGDRQPLIIEETDKQSLILPVRIK